MTERMRSSDRFFHIWLKGLSFSAPVVVTLFGLWANQVGDSVRSIQLTMAKNDSLVASMMAQIDGNTKDIGVLRDWIIRFEGKLDRVLEKK